MKLSLIAMLAAAAVTGGAMLAHAQPPAANPPASCGAGDKLRFICGVSKPEDLVQIPASAWIIASGLADAAKPGSGGLTLIDPNRRIATKVALPASGRARAPYQDCPGPLDPAQFSAHGMNIQVSARGKSTLLVVGHGGREAIEVFDVDSRAGTPSITWAGCIPALAGAQMNSVVGLSDGRVLATDFYHAPMTMQDAQAGRNTGAVYGWKPGGHFEKLPGTDLPGPNGIEVTPDHRYLFVAVTGTSSVMRYELAATEKPPAVIKPDFRTDNLRWAPDGKLLLAGPRPDPACRPGQGRCLATAMVGALDPRTLVITPILQAPAEPDFQGLSSALIYGRTVWLGSYQADRVAYASLGSEP